MSGSDKRRRKQELVRQATMGTKSPGSPDRFAKIALAIAIVLALLPWGLPMIGVSVNLWLGGIILAAAFGFSVYAFWIWKSEWSATLRIASISVAGALYFSLVGREMISEHKKEHKPVTAIQPTPAEIAHEVWKQQPPTPNEQVREIENIWLRSHPEAPKKVKNHKARTRAEIDWINGELAKRKAGFHLGVPPVPRDQPLFKADNRSTINIGNLKVSGNVGQLVVADHDSTFMVGDLNVKNK